MYLDQGNPGRARGNKLRITGVLALCRATIDRRAAKGLNRSCDPRSP
jgi:hypothetical protein